MTWIFYIDWQQYWKCNWIMNIDANAHGKRMVWTKLTQHKWHTWQSCFQWHRRDLYWASFQVTRLFHSATVSQCNHFFGCNMYLLFENSPGWLLGWRFVRGWGVGEHSAPMFLLFGAVYWSLGRRGYFGVSNVAHVIIYKFRENILERSRNVTDPPPPPPPPPWIREPLNPDPETDPLHSRWWTAISNGHPDNLFYLLYQFRIQNWTTKTYGKKTMTFW